MSILPPIFAVDWFINKLGDVFSAFNEMLIGLMKALLTLLERLITITPYPQEDGSVKLLGQPENAPWDELYTLYETSSDLAIFILMILLIVAALLEIYDSVLPTYNASDKMGNMIKAIMLSAFWWPIGAALLAFSDLLAQMISNVYSGDSASGLANAFDEIAGQAGFGSGDVEGSPSGIEGIAFSLALIIPFILQLALMLALLVLWMIRYFVIFLFMPIMPLAFALWAFDFPGFDYFSGIGGKIMKGFVSLVFLSFPAAVIIAVLGAVSEQLFSIIDDIFADGADAAGSMALADGVAATGASGSIAAALVSLLIGVLLLIALPVIAAGGPFYLLGKSRGNSVDMGAMKGGVGSALSRGAAPGALGTAGRKISSTGSSAKGFTKNMRDAYSGESSSGRGSGTASSGSSGTSASGGQDDSVESETSSSRFGRMKQRMSNGFETAKNIHDESAGATAGRIGARAGSAGVVTSQLMKEKTKKGAIKARNAGKIAEKGAYMAEKHGFKDVANLATERAMAQSKNAINEKRVAANDAVRSMKQKEVDVANKIDRNLSKNKALIGRAKNRFDDRRDRIGESDKSMDRLKREYVPDERTTEDIVGERADIDKKEQTEKQLESYLKSVGKWEEYQEMGETESISSVLRGTDGQDIKSHQMPKDAARDLGLDPSKSDEIDPQFSQDSYTRTVKDTEELIKHSDEFDSFEDIKEAAKHEAMTTDEFIKQKRREVEVTVDQTSIDAPDKKQVNNISDAYEKYGEDQLIQMAKAEGYGHNIDRFVKEEMVGNQRKRDLKTKNASEGELIDGLSQINDNVNATDSVKSEHVNDKLVEMEQSLTEAQNDIDRAGLTENVVPTDEEPWSNEFGPDQQSASAVGSLFNEGEQQKATNKKKAKTN